MGALHSSYQSATSSSNEAVNINLQPRKSKRLIRKLHMQSDLNDQTTAIDLNFQSEPAHYPETGENVNKSSIAASRLHFFSDLNLINSENQHKISNRALPLKIKQVPEKNRHDATHTNERVETESTKHNEDKATSFNPTATDETTQGDSQEQSRKSSKTRAVTSSEKYQKLIESVVRKVLRDDLANFVHCTEEGD